MADDNKKINPKTGEVSQGNEDEDDQDTGTGSFYDAQEDSGTGGTGGKGGTGGQTGAVEFRYKDAMSTRRDDVLPPNEIRRLQIVHKDIHKERVKKQMLSRKDRAARLAGNPAVRQPAQYQVGYGGSGGALSRYKKHPVTDKMRGMADPQVIGVPNLSDATTNADLKDRLENQLQNRHRYQNVPKFNPRPRPV
jgi:hypothetical protein